MPDFIDSSDYLNPKRPSRRGRFVVIAALLFVTFIVARIVLSDWVDLLWFESLGYGEVFWKTFLIESSVFLLSAAITFLVLYGAFFLIRRSHHADLPTNHAIVLGGQRVSLSVAPALRVISLVVSIVVALLTGLTMMSQWPTLALFWYAPHAAGPVTDPIFSRPLNFFLFTLPAWRMIDDWLLTLAIATCAVAVLFLIITSGSRTLDNRRLSLAPSPWRGLSCTAAFFLLVLAMTVFVERFELLLDHHTLFDGINYTDAHITAGGLLLVAGALVLGAIIAAINAVRDSRVAGIVVSVLPAVLCYGGLTVVGWYVANFIVKPNQLVREEPYITHNIEMTRQAYGLDHFSQSEFPAEATLEAADASHNQPTLQNIRLWDWRALQDTLRQVQEIRTYYDFPDIDIDRYVLNGKLSEEMLAVRELNVEKLPVSSRNWINEKLIYTHGYGITMNPVNGFTPEGLPNLLLSNMPVQSTVPGLKVTRPELYFGELTDTDVYVKTRQQEFDYPQGQANNLTSYQGTGGIALGGFARRLIIAFDHGDLGTLPFSDDVTPESRLLMHRNIRDRVARLAPFLTFDQDPYMVVGDDGRLSWIIDAYTTSDSYPYSTHYSLGGDPVNYIRNSVKVVVDAYNGTTTFYVFDTEDPVLGAYRRIYPTLFTDAAKMPADLRRHARYPQGLFSLQAEVYGLYHMTRPEVFFNREDLWTVATETSSDANGQQSVQPMQPNYVLMKLPGGTQEEFVQILPFTPANRNNLIGWIAGRSDGEAYGTTAVYNFPKTRLIDGPQQIEARIDQNAQLSGQLTLWNQQGSHVLRGSLLVIPTGRALLYAEPIYLQAQQSPMPELRLVVLALQDKLAYGTTFQAALAALFGGEASSLTASETPLPAQSSSNSSPITLPQTNQTSSQLPADLKALIADANKNFGDYQRLTAAGKLAEAGQKLEALKSDLARLDSAKR
ncbi:UPF0182 family membrane protein [Granulicella aggregans]|uniref:UPF0182 family membrane protein n=1 Tax=Granulicella aggregans TaxID=474949 RepID=UPI0021E07B44|nr:UPF0182 family protein [Granulicella aggregans]